MRSAVTKIAVAALAVAMLAAVPARADEATAVARDAYDKGMAHYHLEEYDAAIDEWERGFRAKPAPEFLYNIAQAYRLSKRPDKALSFYQKYLRVNPEAKNRDEVEKHIAALKEIVDKQKSSAESPPQGTLPTPPPGTPSATPTPTPSATPAAAAPTTTRADLVAQPAERPVYKKAWFWGVMGGVAAVVAAGVVVGVVYGTRSNVQTLPDARFP
jgi:tetratricopeptide (TPR) repeat protein